MHTIMGAHSHDQVVKSGRAARRRKPIVTTANVHYIGIAFALVYWFVDSCIDVFLYNIEMSLAESFFMPAATQLWLRGFVLLLFMMFSVYVKGLLEKHEHMQNRMGDYEKKLEYMVADLNMEMSERKLAIEELLHQAITDPLTGIYNRRKLHEVLLYEISRKYRYDTDLSVVICDVDHFKYINDLHGHHAGDNVLIRLTELIGDNIRASDIFARWGGEEFIILMPGTDEAEARIVVRKLRELISSEEFPDVGQVTASFGVAVFDGARDSADSFISRADSALYRAKRSGRNDIRFAV